MSPPWNTRLALLAITALALALRLYGLQWGLPQTYEEAYPLKVAWRMWGWGPDRELTLDPRFFRYPTLVPYLHMVGQGVLYLALSAMGTIRSTLDYEVLYLADKTPFYLAGRTITAALGAATAPATYLLARRLTQRPGALLAALLVAVNPTLIAKSQEIEVDVPLTLLVTLGLASALRLLERPTASAALGAGVVVGLAASAKYPGAFVLVAAALALAMGLGESDGAAGTVASASGSSKRTRPARERPAGAPARPARAALLPWVLLLAGAAITFLLTSPYVLLNAKKFLEDIGLEREHMELGHFGVEGSGAAFYASAWLGRLLGPLLGVASALGLVLFALQGRRWAWVLAGYAAVHLAVLGVASVHADRYLLPLVPLGTAATCALLELALARRWLAGLSPPRWRVVFALAALVTFAAGFPALRARWERDSRTAALEWMESHVPPGAFVASEYYGPDLVGVADLPSIETRVRTPWLERARPRVWAVVRIPMFQVDPARSAGFYDPELYRDADLIVVTSAVRERYRAAPEQFPEPIRFYDELERRFRRVAAFPASGAGPEIVVYRDPRQARWFPERDSVRGPGEYASSTGAETRFFWTLGVGYESAGHAAGAIACYLQALRLPSTSPELYLDSAGRLGFCLVRTRTPDETRAYLRTRVELAASREEARALAWVDQQIASGRPVFANHALPAIPR